MNEPALIEKIKTLAAHGPQVHLGIGDDCAIHRTRSGDDQLFKIDPMIEGVHFTRAQPASIIGQRALARNLSDIAAMGGTPDLCLVSLAMPAELGETWLTDFYRGLLSLARKTGTALAGGHLAQAKSIYCDVFVHGHVSRGQALLRSGAKSGDSLYVSGCLGKAWDGRIQPRLALGQSLLGKATACMDVSDGLSLDLRRLGLASKLAAVLERVPIVRGATLERALHGGEDYELLFTLPARMDPPKGVTRIGTMVRGKAGEVHFQGKLLPPRGHDHFA